MTNRDSENWFSYGAAIMGAVLVLLERVALDEVLAAFAVAHGTCCLMLWWRYRARMESREGRAGFPQLLIGASSLAGGLTWIARDQVPSWVFGVVLSSYVACMLWARAIIIKRAADAAKQLKLEP